MLKHQWIPLTVNIRLLQVYIELLITRFVHIVAASSRLKDYLLSVGIKGYIVNLIVICPISILKRV